MTHSRKSRWFKHIVSLLGITSMLLATAAANATSTLYVTQRAQAGILKDPANDDSYWQNTYGSMQQKGATTKEIDLIAPLTAAGLSYVYSSVYTYSYNANLIGCQLLGIQRYSNTTTYVGSLIYNPSGSGTVYDSTTSTATSAMTACWSTGPYSDGSNQNTIYGVQWTFYVP